MNLEALIKEYIPTLFVVIGVGGAIHCLWGLAKSISALSWRLAKGEIIRAGLIEDSDGESTTYKAAIQYRYEVNGIEYVSEVYAFGYLAGPRFIAKGIVEKYRNALTVNVYYNPLRPGESVLIRGVRLFHIFNLAFFGLFLWISISAFK